MPFCKCRKVSRRPSTSRHHHEESDQAGATHLVHSRQVRPGRNQRCHRLCIPGTMKGRPPILSTTTGRHHPCEHTPSRTNHGGAPDSAHRGHTAHLGPCRDAGPSSDKSFHDGSGGSIVKRGAPILRGAGRGRVRAVNKETPCRPPDTPLDASQQKHELCQTQPFFCSGFVGSHKDGGGTGGRGLPATHPHGTPDSPSPACSHRRRVR